MNAIRSGLFTLAIGLVLGVPTLAQAQWVYVPEEGGWKDTQTGLVWWDVMVSNDNDPTTNPGGWPWSYTQQAAGNFVLFGLNDFGPIFVPLGDWRTPSLAEMQTAVAHGIGPASAQAVQNGMMPILSGPYAPYHGHWWSSTRTSNGKYAYAIDLWDGTLLKTGLKSSLIGMFVRQGTVAP